MCLCKQSSTALLTNHPITRRSVLNFKFSTSQFWHTNLNLTLCESQWVGRLGFDSRMVLKLCSPSSILRDTEPVIALTRALLCCCAPYYFFSLGFRQWWSRADRVWTRKWTSNFHCLRALWVGSWALCRSHLWAWRMSVFIVIVELARKCHKGAWPKLAHELSQKLENEGPLLRIFQPSTPRLPFGSEGSALIAECSRAMIAAPSSTSNTQAVFLLVRGQAGHCLAYPWRACEWFRQPCARCPPQIKRAIIYFSPFKFFPRNSSYTSARPSMSVEMMWLCRMDASRVLWCAICQNSSPSNSLWRHCRKSAQERFRSNVLHSRESPWTASWEILRMGLR